MVRKIALGSLLACTVFACQAQLNGSSQGSAPLTQSVRYYDGQRWRQVWIDEREVAEFIRQGQEEVSRAVAPAAATLLMDGGGVRIWQFDVDGRGAVAISRSLAPAKRYSPVFHLSAAGGARLALSGNIVVRFKPEWSEVQVQSWLAAQNLEQIKLVSGQPVTLLLRVGDGLEALERANAIQESGEVLFAMPEWWREVRKR